MGRRRALDPQLVRRSTATYHAGRRARVSGERPAPARLQRVRRLPRAAPARSSPPARSRIGRPDPRDRARRHQRRCEASVLSSAWARSGSRTRACSSRSPRRSPGLELLTQVRSTTTLVEAESSIRVSDVDSMPLRADRTKKTSHRRSRCSPPATVQPRARRTSWDQRLGLAFEIDFAPAARGARRGAAPLRLEHPHRRPRTRSTTTSRSALGLFTDQSEQSADRPTSNQTRVDFYGLTGGFEVPHAARLLGERGRRRRPHLQHDHRGPLRATASARSAACSSTPSAASSRPPSPWARAFTRSGCTSAARCTSRPVRG